MEYPLIYMWEEFAIAVSIHNSEIATQTTLDTLAIASVLSEKASKELSKVIKGLHNG